MPVKLKWSSLLNLTELDFVPSPPTELRVSDELIQVISWLTGTTGYDRRLLRCDAQGALLVAEPWSNLNVVETAALYPQANTPDTATCVCDNKGVLIASSKELVKITIVRVSGGATEDFYVATNSFFWFPHKVYSVTATVVPADTGTPSYVGLMGFN